VIAGETTHNTIGPSKLTTARPIPAPCSSCSRRRDPGDPSKPETLASTTTGRFPLAALIARATFLDDLRKSVAAGPRFRAAGGQKAAGGGIESEGEDVRVCTFPGPGSLKCSARERLRKPRQSLRLCGSEINWQR
jgi:hypothetical protein